MKLHAGCVHQKLGNMNQCENCAAATIARLESELEEWPDHVLTALGEPQRNGEDVLEACARVKRKLAEAREGAKIMDGHVSSILDAIPESLVEEDDVAEIAILGDSVQRLVRELQQIRADLAKATKELAEAKELAHRATDVGEDLRAHLMTHIAKLAKATEERAEALSAQDCAESRAQEAEAENERLRDLLRAAKVLLSERTHEDVQAEMLWDEAYTTWLINAGAALGEGAK